MDTGLEQILSFGLKVGSGIVAGIVATFGFLVRQLDKKDKIIKEKDEYIKQLIEDNQELMGKYYGISKARIAEIIREIRNRDDS